MYDTSSHSCLQIAYSDPLRQWKWYVQVNSFMKGMYVFTRMKAPFQDVKFALYTHPTHSQLCRLTDLVQQEVIDGFNKDIMCIWDV